MSEHLPECRVSREFPPFNKNVAGMWESSVCTCNELQRAYERGLKAAHEDPNILVSYSWTHGYAAGLDAAREAIAALPFFIPDPDGLMFRGGMSDPAGLQVWLDREAALAAIDALREGK